MKKTGIFGIHSVLIFVLTAGSLSFADIDTVEHIHNQNLDLDGKVEMVITAYSNPLDGSVLNLKSEDIWLYFPNIKPSVFNSRYLSCIQINGNEAKTGQNIRIDQYLQGTVVISHPSTYTPLVVYSQENFGGDSLKPGLYTFYKASELGKLNNSINSFLLKKGYMATFAENENGTGQSRVFVADNEDILINAMAGELSSNISFVRVFPWRWTGKKGWTNGREAAEALDCHWQYDWDNVATSGLNIEYVPMRHNLDWNSYSNINNKQGSTHVLGFNEPDRPDQADMSISQALEQWPNLLASGLRLGSPCPSDAAAGLGWLYEFIDSCDARNYRVDFVAVHWYKGGQNASQFYNWLKQVHERTRRPVWITEWNNGANWTSETHGKPTYQEQAQTIGEMIRMMDSASFVERYSIYEWVEDTRQMFYSSPDSLTPAGVVYRDNMSTMAYDREIAELMHLPCIPTELVPYFQVNDENWQDGNRVIIQKGASVKLGPHPWSGGSWLWSGPQGYSASTREITINNISESNTGNYTARYTSPTQCTSSITFTIEIDGISPVKTKTLKPVQNAAIENNRLQVRGGVKNHVCITIYDLKGVLIYSKKRSGVFSVPLHSILPSGSFILKVQGKAGLLLEKRLISLK